MRWQRSHCGFGDFGSLQYSYNCLFCHVALFYAVIIGCFMHPHQQRNVLTYFIRWNVQFLWHSLFSIWASIFSDVITFLNCSKHASSSNHNNLLDLCDKDTIMMCTSLILVYCIIIHYNILYTLWSVFFFYSKANHQQIKIQLCHRRNKLHCIIYLKKTIENKK